MKNLLRNKNTAMDSRRWATRRHLARCAAVLGIVTAMISGTAGAASAALFATEKCQENASYKICFPIEELTPGTFSVIVRLAVFMSQADAQRIIDAPGDRRDKFGAAIKGSDPVFPGDEILGPLFLRETEAQGRGLFLELSRSDVTADELDEDTVGDDEIYAHVRIDVPSLGIHQTFRSPEISHGF